MQAKLLRTFVLNSDAVKLTLPPLVSGKTLDLSEPDFQKLYAKQTGQ